ncbi:MAG: type IV pilus twitching motility protein PilT [Bdellovibrio sp.]|nr:MAG: type IV pilus twitching motility protein PilT [Bdellovibrio sp.]
MISLQQLLKATVNQNATDLHLVVGSPPAMRINGRIVRIKGEPLQPLEVRDLCYSVLTDDQRSLFEQNKEMDFSFSLKGIARFRVNLFFQRGAISGVFRRIPLEIPSLSSLGLPTSVGEISHFPHGLVLVTGPTGSGKTTTIASIINEINKSRKAHIITLEDPIEYLFAHEKSIVNQREVGRDTNSYKNALKYVLRQDPDVCFLGELRDVETIETALILAETGHLVFATLHTNSAIQTISRIVSVFPGDGQDRIRAQLSFVLNAVLSQRLLRRRDGQGMVAAVEVLLLSPAIRNLIRENKLHQIQGMMQMGQAKSGMITMNQALLNLILKRRIDLKEAFSESPDPEELDALLKKAGI